MNSQVDANVIYVGGSGGGGGVGGIYSVLYGCYKFLIAFNIQMYNVRVA